MLTLSEQLLFLWHSNTSRRRHYVSRLLQEEGRDAALKSALRELSPEEQALGEQRLYACRALNLKFVPCWDLPAGVRRLDCPLGLFVRGSMRWLAVPRVGFVGARRASADACQWVRERASEVARQGWVVVSGGALGIDSAAHEGALSERSETVVVMGVAAGRVYPGSQRAFFGEVLRCGGALVWEHPPGAKTYKSSQVNRNRLIAGLTAGLVIGEAGLRSGSLHTARAMRRLGRPIILSSQGVRAERGGFGELLSQGAIELPEAEGVVSAIVNRSEQV